MGEMVNWTGRERALLCILRFFGFETMRLDVTYLKN